MGIGHMLAWGAMAIACLFTAIIPLRDEMSLRRVQAVLLWAIMLILFAGYVFPEGG